MADGRRWERTKQIVGDALAMPAAERAAFIEAECGDDTELRSDVLSLLTVDTSTRFLRSPDTALRRAAQLPQNVGVEPLHHVGPWELLELLGRGGMGVVHRARHRDDGRIAAVKVLPSVQLPTEHEVTRFEREVAAVRRLDHPGIVKVFDSGEDPASRWFAMELVGGHDLARELRALAGAAPETTPFLPPRGSAGYEIAVAELVVRVLDAVQHAHEHGVVHRDLKPSNILLDARDEPKVADFGLARVSTDTTITRTSDVGGTAQYMSPEQTRSLHDRIDARSDVWSMGVVLYELLTLTRPFDAPTPTAVQHAIVMNDPVPPHERNRRVPRALSAICLRALEKSPQRRYASARAFADELRKFIAGETIDATLPGIAARARSIGRRRRVPLLAAAAVIVCTIAAVWGFSAWQRNVRAAKLVEDLERVLVGAPFSRGDLAAVARARDAVVELEAARGGDAGARRTIDRFAAERDAFIARLDTEAQVHEATARAEALPSRARVTAGATAVRLFQDLHLLDPTSQRYAAGADVAWSLPVVAVIARDDGGAPRPATLEMITLDLETRVPLARSVLGPADRPYAVGAGHARFVVRFASGDVREFDRAPGIDAMRVTLDATLVAHAPGTLRNSSTSAAARCGSNRSTPIRAARR
ncbi:MAG: serine/threonine protein kinase [Planctomycetes bacterium]|nr:serine/threonine protein kinase [Planctomycetota bacterium]